MPIADRNLKPGTVLVARYKGTEHRAEVVKTKDGLRYKLEDGQEFKSPSSAGAAVKGSGKTCDGWEFWSVLGAPPVPRRPQRLAAKEPHTPATAAKVAPAKAGKATKPAARKKAAPKAKRRMKARSRK